MGSVTISGILSADTETGQNMEGKRQQKCREQAGQTNRETGEGAGGLVDPKHDEESDKSDPLGASLKRQFYGESKRLAGWALARTIVPSLTTDQRTDDRARALLALIGDASISTAIAALPYFPASDDTVRAEIIRRIRRGIIGRSFDEVNGGATAVEIWAMLSETNSVSALPEQIVEQLVSAVETRHRFGLNALLHCARKLIELNKLTADDKSRISEALGDLITETVYETVDFDSREATSVSLVRAECVRLAPALRQRGERKKHRCVAERCRNRPAEVR